MTSLLITGTGTPSVCGLPVARLADPDECETLLVVAVDRCEATAAVRARGEVDMLTVTQLREALDECVTAGVRTVVADLRDVSFIDCAGVGDLADARRRARRRDVDLQVVASRPVARVAELLGLSAELGI